MTVYALALLAVTDKEKLGRYREGAADALAKHGGRVVQATPEPVVLEAAHSDPNTAALLAFPSIDDAKNWRADTALSALHGLRNAAGASTIVILPAAPQGD